MKKIIALSVMAGLLAFGCASKKENQGGTSDKSSGYSSGEAVAPDTSNTKPDTGTTTTPETKPDTSTTPDATTSPDSGTSTPPSANSPANPDKQDTSPPQSNPDQTKPDQTKPDQASPDESPSQDNPSDTKSEQEAPNRNLQSARPILL